DRDGNHQTIIPDLTGLKGLFRAANGKTMSRHYGTQNSTDFPSYTATEDRCRPVLVEARFGQELHDNDPATQRPYDAHNFIEFRWSEQVDIGDPVNGFAGGTEETVYGIKYKKASATFNDTTAFGGAITGSGPLTVSGYATFQAGRVQTGSRGTYVSPVPAANDPTVHALYREFSLTAGGTPADQPHRLRISIAGWSEETRVAYGTDWKWFWQGYIDDAQSPSGPVTVPATEFIRDRSPARNSIEGTNSIAAGYGASNYDKDPVEVTTTATGLYGTWDTTAPDFAGLKASSDDWATEPAEYELIPVSSAAGLVSRLEMHFFDNEVQYTAADNWRWLSRTGWYQTDPATIIHPAPESFGGSRPYSVAANTTGGGVRDASFTGASSAFRIRNNAEVITGAELPGFLTGVNAVFYNLTTSHVVADDPYMTVRIDDGVVSWPIANAQLELSYTAYDTGNPSGGFVTDLAGNRLGSTDYIRALDRTPPRITLSLAGANRRELYLVFSKNLSTGLDTEDGIRLDLHTPAGGLVTLTPTAVTSGPMSNRALLFTLPDAVTADQLVHPDSAIRFVNYGTAPNQETGILEPVSAYSDNMGNYVSLAETHRVTDIAIDFLEVLYASDGVNTDGVFGEDEGALRVFDGSGRLLERNITVGTRLVSETSAPLALTMYFDAAPATNTLPDLFEDATGIALPFWLPTILPGFNSRGNTAARRTGTDQILDANRLLRNFVIPEADEEMNPGSRIEMLFRYGDLYCARLSDPEDITSLAPWSFSISETKRQRGGVTILNNVIDSNRREQTIIQVEVAKAGNIVVQVFTLDGNLVRVLERGRKGAGTYSYYWDGTNLGGRPVARGMYFVRVVGPDIDEIRKVMVVKE
ncbi:MAG TPA: FlgD immunoglobulin-like domain containing protein, partial [Treponemataceae bacterium]|nr:FlgD immunoglobulin-like domain containing protein [Treponemataceae bacterium]